MSTTVQPGVGAPEEKPTQVLRQSKTGMGQGSATWPVKIFMIVLCVLWTAFLRKPPRGRLARRQAGDLR